MGSVVVGGVPAEVDFGRGCSTETLMRAEAVVVDEAEGKSVFQFRFAEGSKTFHK